jgi:hypothetical protein
MMKARLNGFFAPDFRADAPVVMDLRNLAAAPNIAYAAPPIAIHDARGLQAQAESEAAFFAQHGFVLLKHETAVTDWRPSAVADVQRVYYPEIEVLVHERLLPGRAVCVLQTNPPLQRGRDTAMPAYGDGVHQDFGLTPEDFAQSAEAFGGPDAGQRYRDGFGAGDVAGHAVFDFWRVTDMAGPLQHKPLAVCDPGSVAAEDVLPSRLLGLSPTGNALNQLSLRFNPAQRWYVYPDMRTDEVLVFKLFEYFKDETVRLRTCFHSAFDDPAARADVQPRQSCEHRVTILYLRDAA